MSKKILEDRPKSASDSDIFGGPKFLDSDLHLVDILSPVLRSRRIPADELWEAVQDAWTQLTADYCRRLVDSVPRRLQADIDAQGDWTGY